MGTSRAAALAAAGLATVADVLLHLPFRYEDRRRFGRMGGNGVFDPMRYEGGPQIQNRAILHYMAEVVPGSATGASLFTAPSVTGLGFLEAVEDATLLALEDPSALDKPRDVNA